MKKILFIVTILFSIVEVASAQSIKIVNSTDKKVYYQLITKSIDESGYPFFYSNYSGGPYQQLIEIQPNSSILYEDPSNPGIPFSTIPSWFMQTSTSTTTVTGAYASIGYATKQKWWKFKFLIEDGDQIYSGNVGPGGDGPVWTGPAGSGYTVTWDGGALITIE